MVDFVGILGNRLTRKSHVYRTISFERLVELLTLKRNVLVRPKLWVDTFEDLLGKSTLRNGSSGQRAIIRTNHIYGQCWTRHTVSDAIWQIYSNGTDGFRLRTRVDRLLGSLKSQVEEPDTSCYIGRVHYLKDNELVEFGKTHFMDPNAIPSEVVASAYLVKRNAFEHEKEVRLIYQANSAKKAPTFSDTPWSRMSLWTRSLSIQWFRMAISRDLSAKSKKWVSWDRSVNQNFMPNPTDLNFSSARAARVSDVNGAA